MAGPRGPETLDTIGPALVNAGLLSLVDQDVLAAHCDTLAKFAEVTRELKTIEDTLDKTPQGYVVQSTLFTIRSKLHQQLVKSRPRVRHDAGRALRHRGTRAKAAPAGRLGRRVTARDYVAIANGYIDDVLAGKIPACKWVRLACERQREDLQRADWRWRFDPEELRTSAGSSSCCRTSRARWARGRRPIVLGPGSAGF